MTTFKVAILSREDTTTGFMIESPGGGSSITSLHDRNRARRIATTNYRIAITRGGIWTTIFKVAVLSRENTTTSLPIAILSRGHSTTSSAPVCSFCRSRSS